MKLSFIGSWGERLESLRESAERMQRSWQTLPEREGMYGPWSLQGYPDGVLQLDAVPAVDLDAIEEAVRRNTEQINQGPRTAPGFYLDFVRELVEAPVAIGGPLFSYNVRCGFSGPRSVRNHVLLELDPAVGNPPGEEQIVHGHLVALARAWEPEYVSACTYAFHKAQKHKKPQQVRVGWVTYIRDDIPWDTALIPDAVRVEAGDGGRYVTLSGTPEEPSLDEALAIRRALGYD